MNLALSTCMRAGGLAHQNRAAIRAVAEALRDRRRLSGDAVLWIFEADAPAPVGAMP
ncbi:MAG: hypothetical protein ACXWNE_09975 [Candidatus Binataceae bacterium]